MTYRDFEKYIQPGVTLHIVGIGGVSMSALAKTLAAKGIKIQGSDSRESDVTASFINEGVKVHIGHRAENIEGADAVVRTAAVHDDNPEIAAAKKAGIPVFERAMAWGAIMSGFKRSLCIAGTHGKTTTTGMCTCIALQAGLDPAVMIGGNLGAIGGTCRTGGEDLIIAESCEYCNSFLHFCPTDAVILNIEADHLDFFADLDDIVSSFTKFAMLTPENGNIILNRDDPGAMRLSGLPRRIFTFGLSEGSDMTAEKLSYINGCGCFTAAVNGKPYAEIKLRVPGKYNVLNALAACACAYLTGIDGKTAGCALEKFSGVGRRFEYKGSFRSAQVYDDYAHHPTELSSVLQAVKGMGYNRVICIFQPHTYTRTKALLSEFAEALTLADVALLADIYAAREVNESGVSSADIAAKLENGIYLPTFSDIEGWLKENVRSGDIILTVGAGDIYKLGQTICAEE